nr:hypothetical protein [Tanacetum cinerariifolium]
MKAMLALLEASLASPQTPKTFQPNNKGLVAEIFDWDKEEVSEDEEVTQVKGASPSSEVMPLTFQPHSPKERPGLENILSVKYVEVMITLPHDTIVSFTSEEEY